MRILQVHNRYRQRGGEDGVLAAEADLLRAQGHEVHQYLVENPTTDREAARALLTSAWNRYAAEKVAESIERIDPTVVHFHNTWFSLTAAAINASARLRPTVVTLHNYRLACVNSQFLRDGRPCTDCLGRVAVPGVIHGCYRSSRIASMAAATAQVVIRRSGVLDQDGVTVLVHTPFAKDVASRSGVGEDRLRIHENFVGDPGVRVVDAPRSQEVLFVGRLSHEKGADLALDMWKHSTGRGLRLTIVGDGPERAAIEGQAREFDDVFVAGRLEPTEIAARMIAARCLLVPSRWYESQPLVVLEALAAGLPVIATDWPPLRAALASMPDKSLIGLEGWGIEAADTIASDSWIGEASRAARGLYLEQFTPAVAYRRLIDLYEEITA